MLQEIGGTYPIDKWNKFCWKKLNGKTIDFSDVENYKYRGKQTNLLENGGDENGNK